MTDEANVLIGLLLMLGTSAALITCAIKYPRTALALTVAFFIFAVSSRAEAEDSPIVKALRGEYEHPAIPRTRTRQPETDYQAELRKLERELQAERQRRQFEQLHRCTRRGRSPDFATGGCL